MIATDFSVSVRSSWVVQFGRSILLLSQRDALGLADLVPVVIDHPAQYLERREKRSARRTGRTAMSARLARVMSGRGRGDCCWRNTIFRI